MTEHAYVEPTRASYDRVAVDYARLVGDALDAPPLMRAAIGAFAEHVRADGGGLIADVGCGPGQMTAFLAGLGADVLGIDLSPGMIAVARDAWPSLRFAVGSMTDLDLADGSVAGVLAWYSVIHVPDELVPTAFAEFARVLRPGGRLLLGFHVGDHVNHKTTGYGGHAMSIDVHLRRPEHVVELLREAGIDLDARVDLEPSPGSDVPQCYLLARKPDRA